MSITTFIVIICLTPLFIVIGWYASALIDWILYP